MQQECRRTEAVLMWKRLIEGAVGMLDLDRVQQACKYRMSQDLPHPAGKRSVIPEPPGKRVYIPLERCFRKVHQFPGPMAAIETAGSQAVWITILFAQESPAGCPKQL
jgi:hypothetical protein